VKRLCCISLFGFPSKRDLFILRGWTLFRLFMNLYVFVCLYCTLGDFLTRWKINTTNYVFLRSSYSKVHWYRLVLYFCLTFIFLTCSRLLLNCKQQKKRLRNWKKKYMLTKRTCCRLLLYYFHLYLIFNF
jgi:hypothetical protein